MNASLFTYDPVARGGKESSRSRRVLDGLRGKVIGFIDNAKPNFNHLVDDIADLLVSRHGVTRVVKHRKRGQVPVGDAVMAELAGQCDAIIAGSGD